MKLLRHGPPGREKPGMIDADGTIRDISSLVDDIAGPMLDPDSLDRLRRQDLSDLPQVDPNTRIGPCVGNVGKFICIGLNYSDHAAETGA
ncbi:ureidoglycolate lyase, partial [Staphylococcus aureus]